MAQPIADEELQLKRRARRRLIGAVVLVMVVVLVLPMVLDTEPKPASQDIDIRIPSSEPGALKSKIVPIAPAPESKPPLKAPAPTVALPEGSARDKSGVIAAPVAKDAPGEKGEPTAKAREPAPAMVAEKPSARAEPQQGDAKQGAESTGGAHVVQVAALLNAERAKEIHQRLQAGGIKSYTEVIVTARGDVTRVRAGPYATNEAAEKARAQIQRMDFDGKKLDGKVIPVK
jgi:DedD protein